MITATYNKESFVDDKMPELLKIINQKVLHNDDDCLIINVGLTGSGKSTLSAIEYKIICELRNRPMSAGNIILRAQDFADKIGGIKEMDKKDRIIIYDELKLGKRSAMTKWNKDILQLYSEIRGLNCIHIWNHPSLEMIDKGMIKDRVNGVFFIFDKHKDKPRRYLFFTRDDVLKMLGKHKKLDFDVLKIHGREYAKYMGYFGRYDGEVMDHYREIKASGMHSAISEFQKKYGNKEAKKKRSDTTGSVEEN